ncbi:hypothetical protein NQZ68_019186 [Dissostichus eleginoides]|nr:hypothetical protein NQZ68_019186 [Dissostichus eleginoides]
MGSLALFSCAWLANNPGRRWRGDSNTRRRCFQVWRSRDHSGIRRMSRSLIRKSSKAVQYLQTRPWCCCTRAVPAATNYFGYQDGCTAQWDRLGGEVRAGALGLAPVQAQSVAGCAGTTAGGMTAHGSNSSSNT